MVTTKQSRTQNIGGGIGEARNFRSKEFISGKYSGTNLDMTLSPDIMLKCPNIFDYEKVMTRKRLMEVNKKHDNAD